MTPSSDVQSRVARCVLSAAGRAPTDKEISEDTDLFGNAIVDSLGTIILVSELEAEFNVKLGDDDLFGPDFSTIRGISKVIVARMADDRSSQ